MFVQAPYPSLSLSPSHYLSRFRFAFSSLSAFFLSLSDAVIRLGNAQPHYLGKQLMIDKSYPGRMTIEGGWCDATPCKGSYQHDPTH